MWQEKHLAGNYSSLWLSESCHFSGVLNNPALLRHIHPREYCSKGTTDGFNGGKHESFDDLKRSMDP